MIRRGPPSRTWLLVHALAFLLPVLGSWIDPDTPGYAHTTTVLPAYQYHAPKKPKIPRNYTQEKLDNEKYLKKHGHPAPTPAPAPATPSPTPQPTISPTPDLKPYPQFTLVMSDEFNVPGRVFTDGHDPTWTALDKNDYTNNALHYYASTHATTAGGNLDIKTNTEKTEVVGFDDVKRVSERVTKNFKSAMLQSWNKFCFTGGIIEAEVELPGRSDVGGLWPAFWLLGNIARHTYVGSSSNIWPWSRTSCDPKMVDAQKISGCLNTEHFGMKKGTGRGAPEIDIFEVQPGNVKHNTEQFSKMSAGQPFSSASLQVAPGKSWQRPGPSNWPGPQEWYNNLKFGPNSTQNINFYGTYNHFVAAPSASYDYWSDAISQNRQLAEKHFEGKHKYRLEWEPPSAMHGDGYLHWYLDEELIFAINGTSITSVTGAEIPSEPSYIILNTAVSKEWGFPMKCPSGCPCKKYDCDSTEFNDKCGFNPGFCDMVKGNEAHFKVNWVRVYQDPENELHKVGCSTPERPTRKWIEGNADRKSVV